MTPAKIVRHIPRGILKKHGTIYFMEPGESVESVYEGFRILDKTNRVSETYTQEDHKIAVSPDGRRVFLPNKEK